VEGEDDARILNILLKQQIGNRKKYMFWVLGGISEIFENMDAYKKVFSNIRNDKTLWEKSCLVFDRDFLTDSHLQTLIHAFKDKLNLPAYSFKSYTLESTLFTDIEKLAALISKWLLGNAVYADKDKIERDLVEAYTAYKPTLEARYNDSFYENNTYLYLNAKEKTRQLFGQNIISQNNTQLTTLVRQNAANILTSGNLFRLMNKDDVGFVINKVVANYDYTFSVEADFIELIKQVDKSMWLDEWNFVNTL
jgi:hypothetical protein